MRVLVTGAAGFLGRAFTRHYLAEKSHNILAIDNFSNPYSYWPVELPEHQRFRVDVDAIFEDNGPPFDLVIHMAGVVGGRTRIEDDPLYNADQLRIDSLLFRWAINNAKIVVYPSSSAVYPVYAQQEDTDERLAEDYFSPEDTVFGKPDELYGFSKLAGEVLAHKATKYGLTTLVIRPFSGYGPEQSPEYPIPSIAKRVVNREVPITVWGNGNQTRDFIYINDIVGATVARLNAGLKPGYNVMNIGSGIGYSFNEIASIMCDLTGHFAPIHNDLSRPVGVYNRVCDPTEMMKYYTPKTSLTKGLAAVLTRIGSVNADET